MCVCVIGMYLCVCVSVKNVRACICESCVRVCGTTACMYVLVCFTRMRVFVQSVCQHMCMCVPIHLHIFLHMSEFKC